MIRQPPTIDIERLRRLFDGVNAHGFNPQTGGYNRPGYSDADMAARDWFAGEMQRDGFTVHRDGVNNLFARYGPADGPCVMAGSHLDTVPEGGAFDGVLGACAALECIRTMRDAGIEPKTAVVVVATAEEEGRFGGMLGSQAMVGAVTPEWLRTASDSNDVALMEAMRAKGLDAPSALEAAWRPGSIEAFIELHIEQGPVLERAGAPLGIVSGISGVCNLQVRFTGIANHSGTTPMEMRADAFTGLASFAGAIPEIIRASGTGQSRITIGKVEIQPNTAHTIPGIAEFSIIIRDTSDAVMRKLRAAVNDCIEKAAKAHGLAFEIEEKSWLAPVSLDNGLGAILFEEAAMLGVTAVGLPSGAGHDAQIMQSFCPSGLIFVPSRNGISHSPAEWSEWEDMEKGAQLMLNALLRLSAG